MKALWSSLVREYGEKGLKINVKITAVSWIAWSTSIAMLFLIGMIEKVMKGSPMATLLYAGVAIGISFVAGVIYYGAYPIRSVRFIIVYEDKIIISTSGTMDGPGFISIPRKEYHVEVIARDAEVYKPEKHKVYTLVFNKPIRGCMHIRMGPKVYVNEDELRKLINILKPRKVLLDGYYFPRVYAIFKMICGEKYSNLAERLLKDFSNEIEKYGFHKVCAVMNALKSLCLAKRVNDAVRLAEAIVDGSAFNFVNLIDEELYVKWFYDSIFEEKDQTIAYKKASKYGVAIPGYFILILAPTILHTAFGLDLVGFKELSNMFLILSAVSFLTVAYVFGLWVGFLLDPVFWSRVSVKRGMRGEVIYMILAALIPWFIVLFGLFLSNETLKYFWFFLITSILLLPFVIVSMLIMCGYFQYRVGLKHAEILLNALRKSN